MPTIRLPNGWKPRPYQLKSWGEMERGRRFIDLAWHRRAGKDDVALHRASVGAWERIGTYWHMLPEYSQARKAIWDAINPHTGQRRIDEAFPKEVRETVKDQEMFIRFKNGSTWQVVGSDSYDRLVGAPPVGVVFSEWALAKPEAWTYLRPILAENNGWAAFIWTPRGRNHATRAFESRERDPAWFTQRLSAYETNVFTREQLEAERKAYISECGSEEEGDAKFRQEYLVDFDAAVPGSYYGALIGRARTENRIGSFPYDPDTPVITAWDIGIDDYTSIWFMQEYGNQVNAIDYFETSGEGAQAIVQEALVDSPYWGNFSKHFLPHDVKVREWGAGGKSRRETLMELGVKPLFVGAAQDPAERINATRKLFPIMHFDAEKCSVGLDHLRNYRRRWNASTSQYAGPEHDSASHAADAIGEFSKNCLIKPRVEKKPKPMLGLDAPVTMDDVWEQTQPKPGQYQRI